MSKPRCNYRPWHVRVTDIGLVLFALLFVGAIVAFYYDLGNAFAPVSPQVIFIGDVASLLQLLVMAAFPLLVIWGCWVGPWLIASDGRYVTNRASKNLALSLAIRICFPTVLVSLYLAACIYWAILFPVGNNINWVLPSAFTLVTGIWAWWWTRQVLRRLQQTFQSTNVCLWCGYDLRGTPSDACPECGAKTESSKA